jgi:subtilisin-like proprotein convertase family protein
VFKVDDVLLEGTQQAAFGNINGFITESEFGLGIPGATVTIEGTAYTTTTGDDGMFSFTNIPVGTYDVTATHPIYASGMHEDVEVTDGGLAAADIELTRLPYNYTTTGDPVPIQDMQTSSMTLTIPDDVLIEDMDVTMHITHTYCSDLTITFESPDNTEIALATEVGGAGDNFINTRFDDEAATPIANGSAPFTGSYQPEGSLSDYDGFSAMGTWTLSVTDNYAQDTGTIDYFFVHITTTVAVGDDPSLTPEAFALHQNYPNPFNPSTALKFDVPQSGHVTLAVYNVLGEEVARLADGIMEAGSHVVYFNAVTMPSGLYFARMTAPGFDATRKLVLMK